MRIERASPPSYQSVLEGLAEQVVKKASKARMTARTRSAAFAPVTVRIAKKDVPLAMLAGLMWGGSFNLALATIINARLAALGSSESAKVQADLSAARAFATVSIDEPPAPAPPPIAEPSLPARRVGSVPGPEVIPMFARFADFANCYAPHREALRESFAEALADLPLLSFEPMFGVNHTTMTAFFEGKDTLPRTHGYRAIKKVLELARDHKIGAGVRRNGEQVKAALAALGGSETDKLTMTPPSRTAWVAPRRDPRTKTTFSEICNDYAPHRAVIKTCIDEVLAYWQPDQIAKDLEITHDELYYFCRHGTSLPYGTTLNVLRRVLDAIHIRNSMAEPPAVDPDKLAAAIAALAKPLEHG